MKLQLSGRRYVRLPSLEKITNEIKQKQAVTENLINRILYSKRLLVDHVEALEQCMCHISTSNANGDGEVSHSNAENAKCIEIFTTRNASLLLGTTILEQLFTPKQLRWTVLPSLVLSSGFSALFMLKYVFMFRNKIVEREIDQLIQTIDGFGNCIRRNMTYFNEIIIMKQHELIESRQIERAWDCITASKEATEILYDAMRKLEETYPLSKHFSAYYAPMEELRDSEYFKNNVTDYSPKHIKEFYNIFVYVQSQFLFRLALTIAMGPSISTLNVELVKLEWLVRQLVQEEENHFKHLAIEKDEKKMVGVDTLNNTKTMQNRKGPVAVLQDSSLKLSARMVAVAGECQTLDITLQRLTQAEIVHRDNSKQLVEVANNMRAIENSLSVCFDDFQRLIIVYNKFLNSKLTEDNNSNEKTAANLLKGVGEEFPESYLRVEISQHENVEPKDDFYAYMFDDENEPVRNQKEYKNDEMEILNFEKRITKGKFQPVLTQLKDRINPIREVMLQKEREVLTAKGINVDELFGKNKTLRPTHKQITTHNRRKVHFTASSSELEMDEDNTAVDGAADSEGSEGSIDLEFQRNCKRSKECDNFSEMRNFLAQKQSINLFKLNDEAAQTHPINLANSEDIIESEC